MSRTFINSEEIKSSKPNDFINLKEELIHLSQLAQIATGVDENIETNLQSISDIESYLSNYNFENMISRIEEVEKINIEVPIISQSTEKTITYNEDIIKTYTINFTVIDADLIDYNIALNAVNENNYTAESWNAYQLIVDNNVVTVNSTEEEVNAAILAITEAQNNLVFKNLEELNITIANANNAKNGVLISIDGTDVLTNINWVTQNVNDIFNAAIAIAETEKETNQEIIDAISTLNNAIVSYNSNKQKGTFVPDETAPIITSNNETVDINSLAEWTETVSATDDTDGNITNNIVTTYYESDGITQLNNLSDAKLYIGDAKVNTNFIIKYNVIDEAGNEAIEKVITITVTPEVINVTGITLNVSELTLIENGETEELTETVFPNDATNKTVIWSSSDTDIATVENGIVTPAAIGNVTITATTEDGGFTATCEVTVETTLNYSSNILSFNQNLADETVLNSLTVDNVMIENFDPNTFNYNIELESGTTMIPVISGEPSNRVTDIIITQAETLPGTATIVITTKDETIESEEITGDVNYRIEYGYDIDKNKISEKYFQDGNEIASKTFTYTNNKLSSVSSTNTEKFQLLYNDNITDDLRERIAVLENLNINNRLQAIEDRLLLETEFSNFSTILENYKERIQTLEQFLSNNIEDIYNVTSVTDRLNALEGKVFENGNLIETFEYINENSTYEISRIITSNDNVRVEIDGIELSEGIDNDYIISENELIIYTKALQGSKITVEIF